MKLLTIYIPSYNRYDQLIQQLDQIYSSSIIDFLKIIVSDNSSDDLRYIDLDKRYNYENFIYKRNLFNVGGDANIVNGFLNLGSKYIWILSDDDLLKPNSIDRIFKTLNEDDLDLLYFLHDNNKDLNVFYDSINEFYHNQIKNSNGAGLISNVIYKSDFIKESVPIGFVKTHTCFQHLAILISAIQTKKTRSASISSKYFFKNNTQDYKPNIHYQKSFFGFILLSTLLPKDLKKDMIKNYASFWNLRHWVNFRKTKIAEDNYIYAKGLIMSNSNFYEKASFCFKVSFWICIKPFMLELSKSQIIKKLFNL
ncbi:glycosyltransferase [Flavobacteriaceae bacterium]|nr:glycosyltransferase [Flavobacteriaceae bacterium]